MRGYNGRMKIILSPAKQMVERDDGVAPLGMPGFLDKTRAVLEWLRGLSYDEAHKLWCCSDKIALPCYGRLDGTDLDAAYTPAILAYDGIAFKYMAPAVFDVGQLAYVQEHLRILSGFYGVLRPLDAVVPYRLEMQAKAHVAGTASLYEFWGDEIYRAVRDDDRLIVNLASEEYAKAVRRWLQPEDRFVTCTFAEQVDGKLVQKGVYCKMARGEMVRFMAENEVSDPEELKGFSRLGYAYAAGLSTPDNLVFLAK